MVRHVRGRVECGYAPARDRATPLPLYLESVVFNGDPPLSMLPVHQAAGGQKNP